MAFSGRLFARGRVIAAGQLAHQAIGEVVEIVQALAQIRIGLPQHAGAGVGLHALDRGLRGQAGHHRFFELVHPAAVIGEHAIGFEHVAMLAALDDVAVFEHFVEIGAQRLDAPLRRCFNSFGTSSAMKLVTTTRGSCSTTWPSAMPSLKRRPLRCSERRAAGSAPGSASAESSPEAIISASTIAVVCSASTSSSE